MSSTEPMSQQDIIREAEALSELTLDEMYSPTKFADPLSAALWTLTLDSYQDDQCEVPDGSWFARIDRWILLQDTSGYINQREYRSETLARWAFADLMRDVESHF